MANLHTFYLLFYIDFLLPNAFNKINAPNTAWNTYLFLWLKIKPEAITFCMLTWLYEYLNFLFLANSLYNFKEVIVIKIDSIYAYINYEIGLASSTIKWVAND